MENNSANQSLFLSFLFPSLLFVPPLLCSAAVTLWHATSLSPSFTCQTFSSRYPDRGSSRPSRRHRYRHLTPVRGAIITDMAKVWLAFLNHSPNPGVLYKSCAGLGLEETRAMDLCRQTFVSNSFVWPKLFWHFRPRRTRRNEREKTKKVFVQDRIEKRGETDPLHANLAPSELQIPFSFSFPPGEKGRVG